MPTRSFLRLRAATLAGSLALATAALGAVQPVANAAASTVPATPVSIGTWNTDLQPWLPYQQRVVDTIASTNLDVLALQEVWDPIAKEAILKDPRILKKYPYSYSPPAQSLPGSCGAFVPISTQEDYIRAVIEAGVDTRTLEQPTTELPFDAQLKGIDLALTSQPCFEAITNTMQSFAPGVSPLTAIDRASDGTGERYGHGGSTGQLILSRTPLQDVSVIWLDSQLNRRVTVNATVGGVRYSFADWPRNRLLDFDPVFGPFQSGGLQPDYASAAIATGADVVMGSLNTGPAHQPDGYNLLASNGYAATTSQATYCPAATHSAFPPCQIHQRDGMTVKTDRAIDNVMVKNTLSCQPATSFGTATPASDHIGLSVVCRRPFPATGVLDTFTRADGKVGASWDGLTGTAFYRIASGSLTAQAGGPLIWRPASYGPAQEAYVTLKTIAKSAAAQGVLLKVQTGTAPDTGAISVAYDATAKVVRVSALRLGAKTWTNYPAIPASFAAGDVLGARALPNGDVEVYRNGTLVRSAPLNAADAAFFNPKGGRIGIWTVAAPAAVLDDFGGGTAG